MDFTYTEEQILLRDTVERFLRNELPFEKRQAIIDQHPGYSDAHWDTLAELGLLALPISEDSGGLGGSAIDVMLVMEQLGRALLPAPYVSSILLGAMLIDRLGSCEYHSVILEQVISGQKKLAFAYAETASRFELSSISTMASRNKDGFLISGEKTVVFNADSADFIIVMARSSGDRNEKNGLSLFLVPCDATGLEMQSYPTQDGAWASEITLTNIDIGQDALLGVEGKSYECVSEVADRTSAALCGEASGIMWAIYDITLDYMKTRKQFGETLGSFQAIQHRMVDMYMMCEMAQSMVYEAVTALDGDRDDRSKAVSAAKSLIGKYARKVGQEGVQLHGAIGMTLEYSVGHYFKRLCMINAMFGDMTWHTARYAASISGNL